MGNYTIVNYSLFQVSGDADLCCQSGEVTTAFADLDYRADDTGLVLFMMNRWRMAAVAHQPLLI